MERLLFGKRKRKAHPVFVALTALAFVFFLSGPAFAQVEETEQTDLTGIDRSEYEYEPGEGLHQEEWYDPSDWFDEQGEGISYERDWYGYTYGYGDYYDGYYDDYYYGYYDDDYYDTGIYDDDVYGYYEDGYYDFGYEGFDDWDYDYYTNDWWEEDEGIF